MTVRLCVTLRNVAVRRLNLQPAFQPPCIMASTTLSWSARCASLGCWNIVYLFCSRKIR